MSQSRSEAERSLAESLGATAEPDATRGPGWYRYLKGNRVVWSCRGGRTGIQWASAVLEDRRFHSHQYYDGDDAGLRQALSAI